MIDLKLVEAKFVRIRRLDLEFDDLRAKQNTLLKSIEENSVRMDEILNEIRAIKRELEMIHSKERR